MEIKIGDVVTLAPDAVYYNGKEMPLWVKADQWIVKSVKEDKAIIDKNVSGTQSICSPVSVTYLKVASSKNLQKKADKLTKPQDIPSSEMPQGKMKVSKRGMELVAKYEGCSLRAYKCPAGVFTIGYGHTEGVKQGDTLASIEEAKALLSKDLQKYAECVNDCVRKGLIEFPLNQNQFDALTSFTYNCGSGNLQRLVSGNNAITIANNLLLYNKGGGKILAGLVRRREEERELFLRK